VIGRRSPVQLSGMDKSPLRSRGSLRIAGMLGMLATLGALALGCHSSSTANLGGFSSSIPGDTRFDQFTPQQIQTLCNEVSSFGQSSGQGADDQKLACIFDGFLAAEFSQAPQTDASVQAACTAAYNQCLATPGTTTMSCPTMAMLAGCSATVSEYTACLNDATKLEVQTIESLPTCADLTAADLTTSGALQTTPTPQSCQTFDAKCPALALAGGGAVDGGAGQDSALTTVDAGADAGWPACPPITGWAVPADVPAANCYFLCSTNAGSGDPHAFPNCVTNNVQSPGLGLPDGPIYCIQSSADQAACP
jgi:hypothetical protein